MSVIVFLAAPAAGQCLVDHPGGSKTDNNRPSRADVPAAEFSPLSYVNRPLPPWVCFSAGYRTRVENFAGDSYLLTRFRLGMLIKPVSWFQVYGELQDATAFFRQPPLALPYQSTWDLRRAYVDLGASERSPVAVRAGRQDLSFGSGRLVGTSYWRNASKGFDAALVTAEWDWLSVRAFASAPVVARANGLSHHQQGNNLHGIYGGLKRLVPGSVIEPYVFWRLAPGIQTEAGRAARLDEKTAGVRWAGRGAGLDYDAELAGQTGRIGGDRIRAWAVAALAGYTFDTVVLKLRVFVEYNFASGDRDAKDGLHGTFDQLYPNIHGHHGLADQVAWQNLREARSGARISLRRNWTVAGSINDWWLASARDGFYNSAGGLVARDASGRSGTHVGVEVDGETSYRINRSLEVGAGVGRVLPGEFLKRTGHRAAYMYPYVMVNYNAF